MIDGICCGSLRLESMGRIDITWACDPAQIGNTGEAVCKSGMIDARRFREIPESGQVRCVHNLGRETLAVPRKVGFLESAGQPCHRHELLIAAETGFVVGFNTGKWRPSRTSVR